MARPFGSYEKVAPEVGGPVAAPAAGSAMDALVRSVLDLRATPSTYSPPAWESHLTARRSLSRPAAKHRWFRIGDDAPIGSASYIQLGDGPIQPSHPNLGALPNQLQISASQVSSAFP